MNNNTLFYYFIIFFFVIIVFTNYECFSQENVYSIDDINKVELKNIQEKIMHGDVIAYDKYKTYCVYKLNRPIVLSEYGGLGLLIKNHFNFKNTFSYNAFKNTADLTENIKNLIKNGILPNLQKGLCASVYTQLSDVEEEVNGLMTYDRKIIKVNIDSIKSVNDLLTL